MSRIWSWDVWSLDHETWGWIIFLLYFAAWETYTGVIGTGNMLTDHLRPVFLSAPPTYFLAVGLWLWLGVHFLAPTLEIWIVLRAGGG